VLKTFGIDHVTVAEVNLTFDQLIRSKGGFTYAVFKEVVRELIQQFRKPDGRHYVLLSLDEAEHLRGILHGRGRESLLPSETASAMLTTGSMWVMGDEDVTMLGTTKGFRMGCTAQHQSMVNSFRFMNSDVYFNDKGITVLLRVLSENSCDERQKWWTDIRACRRRRQVALDGNCPVGTVFTTQSEFQFMEYKAEICRIQYELQERGMLVFDAFRAFNSSNSGLLNCSELYGGVEYLGIPFTPEQIYELMRRIAIDNDVSFVTS
jgi:hypothetical protein